MKLSLILAAAGAGVIMAQDLSGQPACATGCLVAAISSAGCKPSDLGCQCGPTQSAIISNAVPCLLASCTAPGDLGQAQTAGEAKCSKYFATATLSNQLSSITSVLSSIKSEASSIISISIISSDVSSSDVSTVTSTVVSTSSGSADSTVTTTSTSVTGTTPATTTSSTTTSVSSAGAAATHLALGAGALAAFFGAVVAL
ncbi:hypothetical protein B0H66DRAFT_527967 [Apodospora peruviana]|uniref:CFEM domain-containing protein n=1 Tax=Apodospora peruviana TaxID=516989 RepID=A0AAE0MFS3_9PEZI|nr:hypothetical protein B0H66DRAFT_527967 [Apodospora peruviana]